MRTGKGNRMPIQGSAKRQTHQEAGRGQRQRGGGRPRWQTQMDRVSPRDTASKDRHKGGGGWGRREDREASAKAGPQPGPLPDASLTPPSHFNRWGPHFQTSSPTSWRATPPWPIPSMSLTDHQPHTSFGGGPRKPQALYPSFPMLCTPGPLCVSLLHPNTLPLF